MYVLILANLGKVIIALTHSKSQFQMFSLISGVHVGLGVLGGKPMYGISILSSINLHGMFWQTNNNAQAYHELRWEDGILCWIIWHEVLCLE